MRKLITSQSLLFIIGFLCIAGLLVWSVSQSSSRGYASDTFVGTQFGYAGAAQTVVPMQGYDGSNEPIAIRNADQFKSPPHGASAITPPVTEEKVRDYVFSKPLNISGKEATGFQITSLKFMTTGKLRQLLNDPVWDSWPKDHSIVYVTFSGSFPFSDMDGVDHEYPYAFRVFDALTGNELQAGAGPQSK